MPVWACPHFSPHTHSCLCPPTCLCLCLPVPVGKFFFSFLSACVHDCNLHAPTHASTPLPVLTHMHLSGHAHASCPVPTLAYACLPACAHACPPVPVGKFFFSFLSVCVHNCNLHAPTHASTPLLHPPACACLGMPMLSHPMPTLAYAHLPVCAHTCLPVPVGKCFFLLVFMIVTCMCPPVPPHPPCTHPHAPVWACPCFLTHACLSC